MSIQGIYNIQTFFTEDFEQTQLYGSTTNTTSPGRVQSTTLASGNNAIVIPANTTGFAIIPPTSSTVGITLKGVSGDTGLAISPCNPTMLGITSTTSTTQCVLTASTTLVGVRMIFI